jgi:hypothetical protein
MAEGGQAAVAVDEDVVYASKVRDLEKRVRELERLLRKKTMEVEALEEALDAARAHGCAARPRDRRKRPRRPGFPRPSSSRAPH